MHYTEWDFIRDGVLFWVFLILLWYAGKITDKFKDL